MKTSSTRTLQTDRTTTYLAGASVGVCNLDTETGKQCIDVDPQPATGHCVLIRENPDEVVADGEPVVLGIKKKQLVAIPAVTVDNDDPATPIGVVTGHDENGNVYVCTDGQCRMMAKWLFEFLPKSDKEARVGTESAGVGP